MAVHTRGRRTSVTASALEHVVIFTPKDPEGDAVPRFVQGLRGLDGTGTNTFLMSGRGVSIDSRETGPDGHYKRSARAGLYSRFDDEEALGAYAVSDAHVAVVEELIKPNLAGPPLAMDFLAHGGAGLVAAGTALVHVVVFALKPETTGEQYRAAEAAAEAVGGLPGCSSATMGPNLAFNERNQGFTHGFVSTFESPEAFQEHLKSAEHRALMDSLMPHVSDWLNLDFDPRQ